MTPPCDPSYTAISGETMTRALANESGRVRLSSGSGKKTHARFWCFDLFEFDIADLNAQRLDRSRCPPSPRFVERGCGISSDLLDASMGSAMPQPSRHGRCPQPWQRPRRDPTAANCDFVVVAFGDIDGAPPPAGEDARRLSPVCHGSCVQPAHEPRQPPSLAENSERGDAEKSGVADSIRAWTWCGVSSGLFDASMGCAMPSPSRHGRCPQPEQRPRRDPAAAGGYGP